MGMDKHIKAEPIPCDICGEWVDQRMRVTVECQQSVQEVCTECALVVEREHAGCCEVEISNV